MVDFIATAASAKFVNVHDILYGGFNNYDNIVNGGDGNSGGVIERVFMQTGLAVEDARHEDGFSLQGDWVVRDNQITADPTTGTCLIVQDSSSSGLVDIHGNTFAVGDTGVDLDNQFSGLPIQIGPNVYDTDLTTAILALDFAAQFKDAKKQQWFFEGTVATGVHPLRWYPSRDSVLIYHKLSITVVPTGANLTMELLINGSSSQTTDFRILDGGTAQDFRNVGNFNGNAMQVAQSTDYVEMSVLQVGSTEPGQDLLAEVTYVELN